MEPIDATDLIQLLSIDQWKQQFEDGTKLPAELESLRRYIIEHPEVLDEWQRQSDWDCEIASLFDELEVPAGLQQRLLESLELDSRCETTAIPEAELVTPRMAVAVDSDADSQFSRRRVLWSAFGLTACVIFALALSPFWKSAAVQPELTFADLQQMTPAWLAELESSTEWETAMELAPYPSELIESQVIGRVAGWRKLKNHAGCVAMDMSSPRNGRLWVLILEPTQDAMPRVFSEMQLSGDFAAGSWSDGKHVFIAISDESMKKIDRIFREQRLI